MILFFFTIFDIKTAHETHFFFNAQMVYFSEILKFIADDNYTLIRQYKLFNYTYCVYQANASLFNKTRAKQGGKGVKVDLERDRRPLQKLS